MLRSSVLVVVLLAVVTGFAMSDSSAASPGRNGRIAFEHFGEAGPPQIYTMTARGTERRLLTPGGTGSGLSPSYSPSGRRIVFVRYRKQRDLWTMRFEGSDQRPLGRTRRIDETDPSWSPGGKEIVFAVTRPASLEGIWTIGSNGRGRRRLTSGADSSPSWSPDGSEIAFDRYDDYTQTYNIFVVPAGGGAPTSLSTGPGVSDLKPDWSPDGSRILYVSDRPDTFQLDLWTMNPDGSDVRQVTDTPDRDEHDAVWSPDGRWIVYVGESSSHGSSSYQLYVSRPDGSNLRKLTHACRYCAIINDEPSWQPRR